MPKLPKAVAKRVGEAESTGSFEALPEGTYIVQLIDVDGSKEGPAGPYWSWEFDVVSDSDGDTALAGRKLWSNTSLSEKADFKMKEVFEAFGYTTDSDTDEMVGEKIKVSVSQRPIEKGARKGQVGNNIERHMSLESTGEEPEDDEGVF